jgi:hypothetical protein
MTICSQIDDRSALVKSIVDSVVVLKQQQCQWMNGIGVETYELSQTRVRLCTWMESVFMKRVSMMHMSSTWAEEEDSCSMQFASLSRLAAMQAHSLNPSVMDSILISTRLIIMSSFTSGHSAIGSTLAGDWCLKWMNNTGLRIIYYVKCMVSNTHHIR